MVIDRFCNPDSTHAAIIGSPIGLTINAIISRISPLVTEQVSITATARILTNEHASENTNAEQDSSPQQIQVNTSRITAIGNNKTLNTVLIVNPSYHYHIKLM
jgi:hypothetical protein